MIAKTLITREEYLRSSFDGREPDYVEGALVERPCQNLFHSRIQIRLADAFKPWEDHKELFRASAIRLCVAQNKFRVADFAVFSSEQAEAIPEDAPLVVVEVVSPDDRYEDIMSKLADYEDAGVEFIFIADPPVQRLSRYCQGDLYGVAAHEVPGRGLAIPLKVIFG